MFKFIALVLVLLLAFAVAPSATAAVCRNNGKHEICILSIQRSAKYYWKYRAAASIDGIQRPVEVYNCRDRVRVQKDGRVVPFEPNGAGALICGFF